LLSYQDQRSFKADLDVAKATVNEALTEIRVTESEVAQRKADLELAEKTFERYKSLLEQKSASLQEYDEAKTSANKAKAAVISAESRLIASKAKLAAAKAKVEQAKVALEQTELSSPIDGVLAYLNIDKGIYFTPSFVNTKDETSALKTIPMVIIDPEKYEITVEVPFYERKRLKVNREAIIFTGNDLSKQRNGFNEENIGKIIKGSVFSVNPAISPGGRTIKVKIRTTTKSKNIQDGMFVTTWISAEKKENTLVIPYDSLVYQKNDTFVYVADVNEAIAQLKRIKTGLQGFNAVEVLEGISENDLVITKGRFQISEGTKIKIIELD
jgi:RND family efflux transporter MFP subunit